MIKVWCIVEKGLYYISTFLFHIFIFMVALELGGIETAWLGCCCWLLDCMVSNLKRRGSISVVFFCVTRIFFCSLLHTILILNFGGIKSKVRYFYLFEIPVVQFTCGKKIM